MFRNEAFEMKIAEVQRKIEEMKSGKADYSPASPTRSKTSFTVDEGQVDAFYKEMDKFYANPKKHESPTRRLRQQINAAWEHKSFLAS